MLRPVTIQYLDVKGAKGSVSDIIPMDIDGDGFLDLVGTSLHFPQQNKSIPVFALINSLIVLAVTVFMLTSISSSKLDTANNRTLVRTSFSVPQLTFLVPGQR